MRLSRQGASFDLIFSDPPYAKGLSQASLNLIAELNLLNAGGLMIVEHGAEENLLVPTNLRLVRSTIYGHTTAVEIFTYVEP